MTTLDRRLAHAILTRNTFTADDVTEAGRYAVDDTHGPNGAQSAIGSAFRAWKQQGLIEQTGHTEKSRAPHRKGGMIQVWRATAAGQAWAKTEARS